MAAAARRGGWVLVLASSLALVTTLAAAAEESASTTGVIADLPFAASSDPTKVDIDLAPEGQDPFVLTLDTGSTASVMSPGYARSLGVTVRRLKSSPYRKGTRLGRDLPFLIDTRRGDAASASLFEYGLVGGDFLSEFVVEIDYPGKRVRFLDPKEVSVTDAVANAETHVLSFSRNSTRIIVDLEVEGKAVPVVLDTGGSAGAVLSGANAKRAGIANIDDLPDLPPGAIPFGRVEVKLYEASSVRFAGFDLGKQPIVVAPRGLYNQGGNTDSFVGYDILRQFVLRIDYRNKRIALTRAGDPRPTLYGRDYPIARAMRATPKESEPPTAEEREAERARVRAADEQAVKQRMDARAKRLYERNERGEWAAVSDYRLRLGKKEGDVWYTWDEMQAIKKSGSKPTASSPES